MLRLAQGNKCLTNSHHRRRLGRPGQANDENDEVERGPAVLVGTANSTLSPADARPVYWNDFSNSEEVKALPKRMLKTINRIRGRGPEGEPPIPKDAAGKKRELEEGGFGQEKEPNQAPGNLKQALPPPEYV